MNSALLQSREGFLIDIDIVESLINFSNRRFSEGIGPKFINFAEDDRSIEEFVIPIGTQRGMYAVALEKFCGRP